MGEVKIKLGIEVDVIMNGESEKYVVKETGEWGNSTLPATLRLQNMNVSPKLPEYITIAIPKSITVTEQ